MRESLFQFQDPILTELIFKKNLDFDPDRIEAVSLSEETKINKPVDNSSIVSLSLKLYNEPLKEGIPFYMSISMQAKFFWDDGIDKERLKSLLDCNAPVVLLSYIRPQVAQMTTNAGFPPLNLPFMDFTNNKRED